MNGIAVKSHGGTDSYGFANAIGVAYDMVKYNFLEELHSGISLYSVVPTAICSYN